MNPVGTITLAYGKEIYIELGKALGRSLERFNPDLCRALVTDSTDPELLELYSPVIPLRPEWGTDVSQKLHLDEYTPFDRTLFIDCDSIVVRDIGSAFDLFSDEDTCAIGTEFMVPGDNVREADIQRVLDNLSISRIPWFNGGIYYLDRNQRQGEIFRLARTYLDQYREIGFNDFRSDGPADELLLGAAMEVLGLPPISDEGKLMRTPTGMLGKLKVDVISGHASFDKKGVPFEPAIVHFAGVWREDPVCRREMRKLEILSDARHLCEFRARVFSLAYDAGTWAAHAAKVVWRSLPRPLRLLGHAGRTRLRRIRNLLH